MKLSSLPSSGQSSMLAIGLIHQLLVTSTNFVESLTFDPSSGALQGRLIDKCCQVGKERAIESAKFNCKLSAREALATGGQQHHHNQRNGASLLALSTESLLARDPNFADQCEMVLESCCMAHHRTRNCDSGKQFAKSGAACMDVELSKEATIATESFNDCCMSCSLGILAAKTPSQNESNLIVNGAGGGLIASRLAQNNINSRCKLISPLAASLSGQLYEQTYTECCHENLPRFSGALIEPGAPIDCAQSNPCAQRCVGNAFDGSSSSRHRCDCFAGYKLAPDGINCLDIDECKSNQHSCNRQSEVCDNTRGSFRCLARHQQAQNSLRLQSLSDNEESENARNDFSSMRLCPLNWHWNSVENRCELNDNLTGGGFSSSFHRRNSSLFSSSSRLFTSGS